MTSLAIMLSALSLGRARRLSRQTPPYGEPTAHAPHCARLRFPWTDADPYDFHKQQNATPALSFYSECPETQRCLFARDDTFHNAILAANNLVFPTYQNAVIFHPTVTEQLRNAYVQYEASSEMYIKGIGLYKGPVGIGEYRVVPMFVFTTGNTRVLSVSSLPAQSVISMDFVMREEWPHLRHTPNAVASVVWHIEYKNYPCSSALRAFQLGAFADAAVAPHDTNVPCSILNSCSHS